MTVKKNHILQTALFLFHHEGFSNVGVDRIVAESKTAKMTFYKYFPTKIRLIEECLEAESHDMQQAIREQLSQVQHADPLQRIKSIYQWHYDFIQTENFNGSLFHKAASTFLADDGLIFTIIDQHKKWLFDLIQQQLIEFHIKQPEIFASVMMNMLDGMLSNARHDYMIVQGTWPFFEASLLCHKTQLCA